MHFRIIVSGVWKPINNILQFLLNILRFCHYVSWLILARFAFLRTDLYRCQLMNKLFIPFSKVTNCHWFITCCKLLQYQTKKCYIIDFRGGASIFLWGDDYIQKFCVFIKNIIKVLFSISKFELVLIVENAINIFKLLFILCNIYHRGETIGRHIEVHVLIIL